MQEAIPFRTYIPATTAGNRQLSARNLHEHGGSADGATSGGGGGGHVVVLGNGQDNYVQKLVLENSVIVFGKRGCCMCHVVKRLLLGHGVNPAVFEVEEKDEGLVMKELMIINGDNNKGYNKDQEKGINGQQVQFPAVFVGGKLFGGLEKVMAAHISGELVPILKNAGALWL